MLCLKISNILCDDQNDKKQKYLKRFDVSYSADEAMIILLLFGYY